MSDDLKPLTDAGLDAIEARLGALEAGDCCFDCGSDLEKALDVRGALRLVAEVRRLRKLVSDYEWREIEEHEFD